MKRSLAPITTRGVARIFSEVHTIFQITLHPAPLPPHKKLPWLKIWLRCKPKSFFCKWNDITSLWNTLSGVWVHWLMHVNDLSFISFAFCVQGGLYTGYYHAIRLHTTYVSRFVSLFYDTVFVSSFLSRCSASLSTDPLFSSRSLWSARDKTIKTAGDLLTASARG